MGTEAGFPAPQRAWEATEDVQSRQTQERARPAVEECHRLSRRSTSEHAPQEEEEREAKLESVFLAPCEAGPVSRPRAPPARPSEAWRGELRKENAGPAADSAAGWTGGRSSAGLSEVVWTDIFSKICEFLPQEDLLSFALSCKAMRQGQLASRRPLRSAMSSFVHSKEALAFAKQSGCPWDYQTAAVVVRCGSLSTLRWAREKELLPWDACACTEAAQKGDLHTLQWLHDCGCPWNKSTAAAAAKRGDALMLEFLYDNGCPWDASVCVYAAERGDLAMLQWARARECPWNAQACSAAARAGHLEVLQWLRSKSCPWDRWTCTEAARFGHLRVLQWARRNGCLWNEGVCYRAAQEGHLECLQWARLNGCPWNASVCAVAAQAGHLEVLLWARSHGCPWNSGTPVAAAMWGRTQVLAWALANGCPTSPFADSLAQTLLSREGIDLASFVEEQLQRQELAAFQEIHRVHNQIWVN